nr:MAG TPA: hypothetical protein [Caudoviricetes sp.]
MALLKNNLVYIFNLQTLKSIHQYYLRLVVDIDPTFLVNTVSFEDDLKVCCHYFNGEIDDWILDEHIRNSLYHNQMETIPESIRYDQMWDMINTIEKFLTHHVKSIKEVKYPFPGIYVGYDSFSLYALDRRGGVYVPDELYRVARQTENHSVAGAYTDQSTERQGYSECVQQSRYPHYG